MNTIHQNWRVTNLITATMTTKVTTNTTLIISTQNYADARSDKWDFLYHRQTLQSCGVYECITNLGVEIQ